MVGTFLVCLGALVIAILGCAWIGPTGESQQDKPPDGIRNKVPSGYQLR